MHNTRAKKIHGEREHVSVTLLLSSVVEISSICGPTSGHSTWWTYFREVKVDMGMTCAGSEMSSREENTSAYFIAFHSISCVAPRSSLLAKGLRLTSKVFKLGGNSQEECRLSSLGCAYQRKDSCAYCADIHATHHEIKEGDDGEGGLYDALQEVAVGEDSLVDFEVHCVEVRLAWWKRRMVETEECGIG